MKSTEEIISQLDGVKMPFETRRGIIAVTELLQENPQALDELEVTIQSIRHEYIIKKQHA